MTTTNYHGPYHLIKWNDNDLKDIKRAEKQKAKFENKGFTLRQTIVNSVTGICTLTYSEK